MILDEKLAAGDVIVLDGAIGSEIDRLGGKMDLAAWCGVANVTHPDTVRRVHESYLEAGADVITANTFATCRHVLEAAGYGDETVAINRRAVELAREALETVAPDRPVAIAGSMSNNVAWLPGTVGPDPAYEPTPDREAANYREMADTLAEAGCDLLVMEMMTDLEHAGRVTRGRAGHRLAGVDGHQHQPGAGGQDAWLEHRPGGGGRQAFGRLRTGRDVAARDDHRRALGTRSTGHGHHA